MDHRIACDCNLVAAVAYLRRSTSRQEKSLDDQRTEIERYAAAHGYRILRWYQDDGISGDATERRDGFLAFHKAACSGRDFDVILVWDQDRFGRFDSMEAGYWIHPLRKAGVTLVSVTEGPINWDDFTGRVMYSLKQEGKHQFLRDLSRNVSRGQISNAEKGFLCGQAALYGYDRMLLDELGALRTQIDERRSGLTIGAGDLRRQLADLDREIDQGAQNFLRAPAEVLDLVCEKLTAMKRQRRHVQDELRLADSAERPQDVDAIVDAAVRHLWRLGEDMAQAEPARRREVFRLMVERIDLRFDKVPRGKRVECPLLAGEIHLRTGEGGIFGSVNRGNWRSFEPLLATYLDAALGPEAEVAVVTRLTRMTA